MTNGKIMAEYIWLDGRKPTAKLRSKTKVINGPVRKLEDIPMWGFDGSSTEQAEGHFSDCQLKPVYYIPDPINKGDNLLVMCEVLNADGTPHVTNTRHVLEATAKNLRNKSLGLVLNRNIPYTEKMIGRLAGRWAAILRRKDAITAAWATTKCTDAR